MRILLRQQLGMLFLGGTLADDYKNDFKPDQSVPGFQDSISSISWAPSNIGNYFATTTWDRDLRIMSLQQSQTGYSIFEKLSNKFNVPVLKCTWNDQGNQIFVGLMDGSIKLFDLPTMKVIDIGRHGAPISSLHYVPGMNAVVSTAYEPTVHIWQTGNSSPVLTVNTEQKVFCSDFQFPTFAAGLAGQKILIMDINNLNSKNCIQSLDLGKNSQMQAVAINSKANIYGIGSFDGRANISSLNKNVNGIYASKSIITFKSNKQQDNGNTVLFPINNVSFNPRNDKWFMTAGSDGGMYFWDFQSKNKIKSLQYGGNPICAAKLSPVGDMIAYGLGNDWHLGQQGVNKWPVKLGVHPLAQNELKPLK